MSSLTSHLLIPSLAVALMANVGFAADQNIQPVGWHGRRACPPACPPCPTYDSPGYVIPEYGSEAQPHQAVPTDAAQPESAEAAPAQTDLGSPNFDDFANQFAPVSAASSPAADTYALAAIGGYIEPATIQSRFRVSWSDFQDSNAPDRAQYFYGYADDELQYGNGQRGEGPSYYDPAGNIALNDEPSFSELHLYFEHAILNNNASLFIDVPFRNVVGYDLLDGDFGIGDLQLGTRVSLLRSQDFALTAIGKVYVPTGDEAEARGTGHASLEFGVLFQKQVGKAQVFGGITDWFSLDDTLQAAGNSPGSQLPGDSNVLQYGLGVGYQVYDGCCHNRRISVSPVAEFVGWSVLDGKKTSLDTFQFEDADGDFILNGKYGVRVATGKTSFYAGYGHNLTDELWYRQIYRFEITRTF